MKRTGKVLIVGERFDLFNYNVIADSARDFCFLGEGNFGGKTVCWRSQDCLPFACGVYQLEWIFLNSSIAKERRVIVEIHG